MGGKSNELKPSIGEIRCEYYIENPNQKTTILSKDFEKDKFYSYKKPLSLKRGYFIIQ